MKIAVLSDLHFGYAYNSELEQDSFDNAEGAMEKALDSDLVLIGGDIFDTRIPRTQTWGKALRILTKPLMKENSGIKLVSCSKELKKISQKTLQHIPVIAIHGNHERKAADEMNTVEVLENAGLLIHLHLQTIIFEKDGIKVAIHGISNVPERFAKDILMQWNPQPVKDCYNILLLHQSIDPYVYSPLEPPTISLSNLPKGFNLIINGHIHGHTMERIGNTTFIIPGSTVITQYEKNEADNPKVFVKIQIGKEIKINFEKIQDARNFIYEDVKIDSSFIIREQIENKLNLILSKIFEKKPLIKLKIFGKESDVLDKELRTLEKKFSDKAILIFVKELESPEITKRIEFLKNIREQKLSVEEIGLQVLRSNLSELKVDMTLDYDTIFRLLSEGEVENALAILTGKQETLVQFTKTR